MGKLFSKIHLSTDINSCWDFFSSPENLKKLTPSTMDFNITNFDEKKMYEGQRITYTVKPFLRIPLCWKTEIRSVKEGKEFVDVQIKGPYKNWHHRHLFKETKEGIEMIDMVHYSLPYGIIGKMLDRFIIKKEVKKIFEYRRMAIQNLL